MEDNPEKSELILEMENRSRKREREKKIAALYKKLFLHAIVVHNLYLHLVTVSLLKRLLRDIYNSGRKRA